MNKAPTTLIIMDGFGLRSEEHGNAVAHAKTPVLDKLFATCANTTLSASGGHDGTILPVQATYPDGFAPNGMRYCSGNKKAGMIPAFSLMLSPAIRQWKSAWFRAVSVPVLSGKKFAGYRFRIWP